MTVLVISFRMRLPATKNFAAKFREEIRTALGGVDELSISAGVTATEYKSLYGRVAATSNKKAASVYTYGLCRCLELILFQEEQLFRDSLARAAGIEKPLDLPEGATSEDIAAYNMAMDMYEDQVKAMMMACLETEQIPPGVQGLIPDGDITVQWRWMGPVYEDTTQDILNNSIVIRNLQELGVDSIEALKYLFPSKTDEERAEMLSGFPFRMVNELQGAYSQFAKLVGGMMSTPHPQSPDLPMAADPRLDMTPYLYRTLEALQREMSYAGRYRQLDPTDEPSTTSRRSEQLRGGASTGPGASPGPVSGGDAVAPSSPGSSLQLPIDPVSILPPIPTGGPAGQPMGAGIQQGGGRPESSSPIPVPGATLSSSLFNRARLSRNASSRRRQQPQATPSSAPLTWSPNQASSPSYSQASLPTSQAAPTSDVSLDEQIADYYDMSPQTREVLNHYGTEAPAILNEYALGLEQMLDSAVAWGEKAQATIKNYADFAVNEHQENLAYNEILTNPDVLSDYTLKFLVPKVPTLFTNLSRSWKPPVTRPAPAGNAMAQAGQNFPAPPQAAPMEQPGDVWGQFNDQMTRDPANAWRVLNQATPQTMQQKLFVME